MLSSEPIKLAMPMSEEHAILRQSLVPHLLDAIGYNQARKNHSVGLYEMGTVFISQGKDKQPIEQQHLAGALTGLFVDHPWQGEKVPVDFFTVKGILEGLFTKLQVAAHIHYEQAALEGMHPGQTANILLNNEVIGFMGRVHPNREKEYDVKNVFVFELNLDQLLAFKTEPLVYQAIPKYPSITRDIALIVDQNVTAYELEQVIKQSGGKLLQMVNVFDLYVGEHVPEGKKSVAFTLTYFDPEKTLTDEEVNAVHEKVLAALNEKGAELRQ